MVWPTQGGEAKQTFLQTKLSRKFTFPTLPTGIFNLNIRQDKSQISTKLYFSYAGYSEVYFKTVQCDSWKFDDLLKRVMYDCYKEYEQQVA